VKAPLAAAHPQAADLEFPLLSLKRGEDRRIRAGHPWVFSNEVDTVRTPLTRLQTGALVRVQSARDQFLGLAYVNPHALICARIVSRDAHARIDERWLALRLKSALALRERLYRAPYYRLVFGESDGLPGLILDRYGDCIVGQIATVGMEALRPQIEAVIRQLPGVSALFWKNDSNARDLEQLPAVAEPAFGPIPEELIIIESGIRYVAPLRDGQKTGWFFDQTANRRKLAAFLPRAASVLDACCYVGGWSVSALQAGAQSALCLDSSASALRFAARNAAENGTSVEILQSDVFDGLKALREAGRRFDVVVLDPPAFIKRKKDIPQGRAAYRKLNQLALGLLKGEGLLVSCSCSYHLTTEDLLEAVQSAAGHIGRTVQVLEFGGQSADHPVHPAIPETRYLKALFCRVTG